MKAVTLIALLLSGCATTPDKQGSSLSPALIVGGAVIAAAVVIAASGDDSDPPDEDECHTVIGPDGSDTVCR